MLRLYPISLMAGFSNGSYAGFSSVLFTRISTDLRSVTCLRIPDVLSSPLCVQMKYSSRKLLLRSFVSQYFFVVIFPNGLLFRTFQHALFCSLHRDPRGSFDFSRILATACTTMLYAQRPSIGPTYFLLPHPSNIRPIRPRSRCVSHIRDGKQIRFLAYRAIFTRPCFHRHQARPIILAKWTLEMKTV